MTPSKEILKLKPIASQSVVEWHPIQVKKMTEEETKEYHLKKLYELSLKSIGEIPKLKDPDEEKRQKMLAIWTREETYWIWK